jgi:SAM-dependent methyltransferase
MTALLPWLYDHVEPAALRIAERAAELAAADEQRAYLVAASQAIVASQSYRREPPRGASGEELSATLTWFQILDEELEGYVAGKRAPADLIARGGGRLWSVFQGHEPICAAWARGVARALAPRVAGRRVLELGAGTGGTTRLLARALRRCNELVVSDVRQSFLDRIVAWLPGVPVTTALFDVDGDAPELGDFDVIYATNCLHVAKDVDATLARLRGLLRPGGTLVLGEGAHYSPATPSPLALVLALFDGWWDAPTTPARPRPGFLQPEQWLTTLRGAGYAHCCAQTWGDERRQFGGVYWARQPLN